MSLYIRLHIPSHANSVPNRNQCHEVRPATVVKRSRHISDNIFFRFIFTFSRIQFCPFQNFNYLCTCLNESEF